MNVAPRAGLQGSDAQELSCFSGIALRQVCFNEAVTVGDMTIRETNSQKCHAVQIATVAICDCSSHSHYLVVAAAERSRRYSVVARLEMNK